jgi:hypothetical protein
MKSRAAGAGRAGRPLVDDERARRRAGSLIAGRELGADSISDTVRKVVARAARCAVRPAPIDHAARRRGAGRDQ